MDEQVIIVGAGPVGMLAACELLQQGAAVRLIDASREHSAHSRATIVWPRLLELMRRTGLTDRIVDHGHRIAGVAYFSSGRRQATAWMDRLPDTPYPFAVAIAQSETERLLEARLAELGGKIERGVRLTSVGAPGGPAVRVVLEGPGGGTEEVEASWLIGADGAHSTLRKLLGVPYEGAQFDVSFSVTDAEVAGDAPMDVVSYCYTPEGSLALGPLGRDVTRVAVSVPHAVDDTPPSREFFQRLMDERGPGRNRLGELRFSTTFRVHARTAGTFRLGRCLLIGDAAHIMSPAGAQGMNTGLQDAVNIGWRLGGVLEGRLPEEALAGYDAERRRAAHAVARTTALQTHWGLLRDPRRIAVRDAALRAADATGLLQRSLSPLVAQTGTTYRPGEGTPDPLRTTARPTRRVRPGDRLPALPAPLDGGGDGGGARTVASDGGAWLQVDARRHTVVLWPGRRPDPRWAGVARRVRALAGPAYAVAEAAPGRETGLAEALGPRPAVALVRPDGHIIDVLGADRAAELEDLLRSALRRPDPAGA
ncbi:FAD-dependent monooxygenase [Nocardiopsis chromatogenes]|uniref:FAD-dependent monooxygenase n=1 Tax=Nocardiopsis chromatogenes TaxID=280239 RepID=UPI00035D9F29|nr:FAD-dependent monooxygenase [Nocardiopsis chromatogenes]